MSKRYHKILFTLFILINTLSLILFVGAEDGSVIEISSAEELVALMDKSNGYDWSGDYKLTVDIDLSGFVQKPIGNPEAPFTGTFDGGGHTVSGIDISGSGSVGLFGFTSGATVKNLTVSGTVISDGAFVGGLIGKAENSLTLENCVNYCDVIGNADYVGGILGSYPTASGTVSITKCRNAGTVKCYSQYLGGIVGYLVGSDTSSSQNYVISECFNSGDITSLKSGTGAAHAGGIAGYLKAVGNISDCLNIGTVTANGPRIGGLFGTTEEYLGASNNLSKTAVVCKNYSSLSSSNKEYVNSIGGFLPVKPSGNNYYYGEHQGKVWFNNDTGGMSVQYTHDAFDDLNESGKWVIASDPELKFFHEHTESIGYYAILDGENEGYHAPVCICGSADTIDFANKAKHSYGENALCIACGHYVSDVFTITYVLNGGEFVKEVPTEYTAGSGLILPDADAISLYLNIFLGWYDNEALEGEPVKAITEKTRGNMKYYAAWKSPTEIHTAADLASVTALSDNYKLMANIDMSGVKFSPIGSKHEPFTGIFIGNGHTVSNLVIESTSPYQGLFAYNRGEISDLTLDGTCSVTGSVYTGGIAGRNEGKIVNCTDDAAINFVPGDYATNATYKVMQQNLWVNETTMATRQPKMLKRIYNYDPDVITFQEGSDKWQKYLDENLDGYTLIYKNRGPSDNEAVPVAFKTDKFDLVESGHFWISETPEEVSLGWDAGYLRICTYVVIRDKTVGDMIALYSIHLDHIGLTARTEGARLIRQRMNALAEKYPGIMLIAAGDFNGTQGEEFYNIFTTDSFADARYAAKDTTDEITFPDGSNSRIIDFIFVNSDNVSVSKFDVLSETIDGLTLSDHYGTFAVISPRGELDLNNDGLLGIADVVEFMKALENGESGSELDLLCDGEINQKDLLAFIDVVAASDSASCGEEADGSLTLSLDATVNKEANTVALSLDASTVGGFFATKFNVSAPSGFTLAEVDDTALSESGYICTVGQNIVIMADELSNGSLDGKILELTYSIDASAVNGNHTFVLTPIETVDADGNTIATGATNAEVTVISDIDGSGSLTLHDALLVIRSSLDGQYISRGDINADGKLTLADALRVMKYISQ